jgi:hypothetical protein
MRYLFTDPETNKIIEVPRERWCWIAHYSDGTKLKQFDDKDGTFHRFAEIDQKRIVSFEMVNEEEGQSFNLQIPQGADLIHYYRNQVLNFGTGDEKRVRLYNFGWKITIDGKLYKRIIQIFPDNSIRLLDDDGR